MPKKNRDEVRVKREIWNHHYKVVARRNGRLVTTRKWHGPEDRRAVVSKVLTFQEGARYSYLVRAQNKRTGEYRSLTITSSHAVNMGSPASYERQRLFDSIKEKYMRKDEKYEELENFEILSRKDLDTMGKKVYVK